MKKVFSVVIILFISSIYLVGYIKSYSKGETISEITKLKSSNITKIVFYDGRGGLNKPLTVESKQKIDEFIGYLDKCTIKKEVNHKYGTGWIHDAVFYSNDKKVIDIIFGDPIIFNGTEYYDVLKNNLSTDKIDRFLQSVNSSWKSL